MSIFEEKVGRMEFALAIKDLRHQVDDMASVRHFTIIDCELQALKKRIEAIENSVSFSARQDFAGTPK